MSIRHGNNAPVGNNVRKGVVDPSLAANLPTSPSIGDRWVVADGTSGSFENDALLDPQGYPLNEGDAIEWSGTVWSVRDSGEDVWITGGTITGITDLAVSDGGTGASDAATARTNLDVYSTTETDNAIDTDIATHNGVTTAHGISAFGATLVDDATASDARTTLGIDSVVLNWSAAPASPSTAVSKVGYLIDTTSATYSLTLPASPAVGAMVGISDFAGNSSTNNITVGRNATNIDGAASDLVINVDKVSIILVYTGATIGWQIVQATQVI